MLGGEKFHRQELERLEREITLRQYCGWGKWIKFVYGPASDKFSQHIEDCGQCSQALYWEGAETRQ